MGREIVQLVNTTQEAGYRLVQWNATDMHGKPCECRNIPLPGSIWRVCANKEDGTIEVRHTPNLKSLAL